MASTSSGLSTAPSAGRPTAYQGVPGAYSEEALLSFLPESRPVPCPTLPDVFEAVRAAEVERAFVPVENSHAGSVVESYDLMQENPVHVLSEWVHPVDHALLGMPGAPLSQVERAFSHPQALAQTATFLREAGIRPMPYFDTAAAAEMVAEQGDPSLAAVASRRAGEYYGLEVLASGIQTSADNATRFLLLAPGHWPDERPANANGHGKTSLVFATEHAPGALVRALSCFSRPRVNLMRLESRPSRRRRWEYLFYIDVEGYADESHVAGALRELTRLVPYVQVLGSFPAAPSIP